MLTSRSWRKEPMEECTWKHFAHEKWGNNLFQGNIGLITGKYGNIQICFFKNVYSFWERERERERGRMCTSVGEGQRQRESKNSKLAPHSERSPTRGLISPLRDHDLSQNQESDAQLTEHPGTLGSIQIWTGRQYSVLKKHIDFCTRLSGSKPWPWLRTVWPKETSVTSMSQFSKVSSGDFNSVYLTGIFKEQIT